jgi:hypothetical protein
MRPVSVSRVDPCSVAGAWTVERNVESEYRMEEKRLHAWNEMVRRCWQNRRKSVSMIF